MSRRSEPHDVSREDRPDGGIILRARSGLGDVATRTTDWLDHWARETPYAVFLAEREGPGWHEVSYSDVQAQARRVAAGLLDMGVTQPILILSGNSVAHATLALGAHYVGVPVVPLAEQYALIPGAAAQIDHAADLIWPGAVFAEDAGPLADVLARDSLKRLPVITAADIPTMDGPSIDKTHGAVGADTVAKILMTSGSTSSPKGVQTTHRMMCTNQTQIAQCLPFLRDRPPVLVDWLPWNHVFGGSHNFNMVMANGGAMYIDAGKPTPALIAKTIENNRLKQGTISFNVPVGFAAIRDAMAEDAEFAAAFFHDLDMLFYAGASLPQDIWADLERMAKDAGADPLFTSSWGLTETAPAAILQHEPTDRSGVVGVPLPGVEVKLVPSGGRFEARVRGPSIFRGYLGDPTRTAEAFDQEGYFCTGDAMAFVDDNDANAGLRFDGRISEDFKLMTGTWVRAAALRLEVLSTLKGVAQDVVVTGEGQQEVGLLVIPTPTLRDGTTDDDGALISDAKYFAPLKSFQGGSAARIARVLVMEELPSIAAGEITAKGNLNFARIKTRRAALVERLYTDDPAVILVGGT